MVRVVPLPHQRTNVVPLPPDRVTSVNDYTQTKVTMLEEMTDVDISNPSNNQILTYHQASNTWNNEGAAYSMGIFYPSRPKTDEILVSIPVVDSFVMDFTGSVGVVGIAPASPYILIVKNTGVNVGTITVNTSGGFIFANSANLTFYTSNVISVVAPTATDSSINAIAITFKGTRI